MQGCRLSFVFIHRKPIPVPKLFSALQFIGTDPLADLCITWISTCDIDRKKDLVFLRLKLWIPCMVFFSFFLVYAVYFRYIMKLCWHGADLIPPVAKCLIGITYASEIDK